MNTNKQFANVLRAAADAIEADPNGSINGPVTDAMVLAGREAVAWVGDHWNDPMVKAYRDRVSARLEESDDYDAASLWQAVGPLARAIADTNNEVLGPIPPEVTL